MTKEYIKNPFNYIGGKDKLLPIIEQHLPKDCKYMIEPFAGSSIVTANFGNIFKKCYVNDRCWQLIEIIKTMKTEGYKFFTKIEDCISTFNLSKTNKEEYIEARAFYNAFHKDWFNFNPHLLYSLITHAYNYQIEFNKNAEYNVPSGNNRSSFNSSIQNKLKGYLTALQDINIEFHNYKGSEICQYILIGDDDLSDTFFFIDSPYSISSKSCYRMFKWTEEHDKELFECLDEIHDNSGKFMMTNFTDCQGKENTLLKNWMLKYKVIDVNIDYNNCNHQRKNNGNTKEVMVVNY